MKIHTTAGKGRSSVDTRSVIQELIDNTDSVRLPPLKTLAVQLGASVGRVSEALRGLEKDGVIRMAPRRGITVRAREIAALPAGSGDLPPDERLYRKLLSGMESGTYATGRLLPKVNHLARSERVAAESVCRVYRRLVHEGLVYRNGRSFVVGKDTQDPHVLVRGANKCVVIVQLDKPTWGRLALSWWTLPFAQSFMREMAAHGTVPHTVLMQQPRRSDDFADIPSGKEGISRFLGNLNTELTGFLVMNTGWEVLLRRRYDLVGFLSWLCTYDKPVVLFDRFGEVKYLKAASPAAKAYDRMMNDEHVQRSFYHCYIDTETPVRIVVKQLLDHGHRVVGLPFLGKSQVWMESRRFDVQDVAAKQSADMRVLTHQDCPGLWTLGNQTRIGEITDTLKSVGAPVAGRILRRLSGFSKTANTKVVSLDKDTREFIRVSGFLVPFLARRDLTALVAPNDRHAHAIYHWLRALDLSVPGDISLVSFDDRQEDLYPYTISSVNFGFDYLGYTAYHIIAGDIPIRVDKSRSVGSLCRLNHLATIGKVKNARAP